MAITARRSGSAGTPGHARSRCASSGGTAGGKRLADLVTFANAGRGECRHRTCDGAVNSDVRQLRHFAATVGNLAVVALAVSGCVGGQTPGPSSSLVAGSASSVPSNGAAASESGLVAWVDRPAAHYVAPSPSLPPADARPCAAQDVRASSGQVGAGLGNTNLPVSLVNVSTSACSLAGYPTLVGVDAKGGHHVIAVDRGSYFGDPGPPGNIEPGGDGSVNISGADACDAALTGQRIYPTLLVGLPDGGRVAIDGRQFDTICGVFVSAFGVPSLAAPPSEISPLPVTAAISAPATVAAGTTLAFVVTLTNPTGADFSLRPCPSYEEFVGSGSSGQWVATIRDYFLNCDAVRAVPAGGSLRFEMKLALPADQPQGFAKFGWSFQGDGGPWANAALEVTPG